MRARVPRVIMRSSSRRLEANDSYYTPFPIALRLTALGRIKAPTRILDPACGDGSLLLAAAQRWPGADLIGNDISPGAIRRARERCGLATTSSVDFLHAAADPVALARLRRQWDADLVLLNPPFAGRSKHRFPVAIGIELTAMVGQAAAFLLACAQLLRPDSHMIAVMPSSFLTSKRDEVGRELLQRLGDATVIERLPRRAFRDCRAASVILAFRRKRPGVSRLVLSPPNREDQGMLPLISDFIRGNVRVHETRLARVGRHRFLHTTHIHDGRVAPVLRSMPSGARKVRGHAVLLPRVGSSVQKKIVTTCFRQPVAVSDCLYALVTESASDARELWSGIMVNWKAFENEYLGTGAPHLTTESLFRVLRQIPLRANRLMLV
jgi:SAM-dependent methyltransferase